LAELEEVAFDGSPEDEIDKMGGILRIRALQTAYNTFAQSEPLAATGSPLAVLVAQIEAATGQGLLNTDLIVKMAQHFQTPPTASAEFRQALASMLMVLLGTGLLFRPDAAPALEPIRDRIIELMGPVAAEEATPPAPKRERTRCEAILNELAATLERDGFSEYALRQAIAAIQELPNESAEDAEIIHEGLLRLIDISMPACRP
jgi:hypothetical protein